MSRAGQEKNHDCCNAGKSHRRADTSSHRAAWLKLGFNVHRTTGALQTILAGVGTPGQFDHKDFEVFAGVAEVVPHLLALQARRPRLPARRHDRHISQRSCRRRRRSRRHGRPVLGRKPRTDLHLRRAGEGRGRKVSSRRRIQAAQLALLLPGHGARGPQAAARGR